MGDAVPLGPVLVGVSGSPDSDRAVDWAAEYAMRTGRSLLVVHGTGFVAVRPNAQDLLEAERVALEAGRLIVNTAVQRAIKQHPELPVASAVDVGDPPSVLLGRTETAPLLVVGCRHMEGFRRLFGSVSLAVVRHATSPVVVVRGAEHYARGPLVDHVLLGVDGTPRVPERRGVRLRLRRAERPEPGHPPWLLGAAVPRLVSPGTPGRRRGAGESPRRRSSIAETVAGLPERYPDVEVHETHRSADPAQALIEASETARLVVVGARNLSTAKALVLRSVSTALVEHARCPVAVVHMKERDRLAREDPGRGHS